MSTNAPNADLNLINNHRFCYDWKLDDLNNVEKNGKKVFSCFSCGGGSSMGYKLAGFDIVGCCELDSRMIEIYKKNLHPKYSFLMDIRDFLSLENLPKELFDLDILDGSPPCSVFSLAGEREKNWGKKKKFREGQKEQRLDDLFFYFLRVVEKLKPKIFVAENVKGLLAGNARSYAADIIKEANSVGYDVQVFLLNAAKMGVPQRRERVFFVGRRNDLKKPKLVLDFNESPILFGDIRSEHGRPLSDGVIKSLVEKRRSGDRSLKDVSLRVRGKSSFFNNCFVLDEEVAPTLTSGGTNYRFVDGEKLSFSDMIAIQTFPRDYDFGKESVQYVCGMSVPPVMMANLAAGIHEQWLK